MAFYDPISPELALVCPELRERALEHLPPPGLGFAVPRAVPLLDLAARAEPVPGRPTTPALLVAALAYGGLRLASDVPVYALTVFGVFILTLVATLLA